MISPVTNVIDAACFAYRTPFDSCVLKGLSSILTAIFPNRKYLPGSIGRSARRAENSSGLGYRVLALAVGGLDQERPLDSEARLLVRGLGLFRCEPADGNVNIL